MLNEKLSDPFGWKQKLDGLTGLPGEAAPDCNAAWEKLRDRLQVKPHRNKAVWYWAAAVLLLACIIPLLMPGKKDINLVQRIPEPQNKIVPPVQIPVPARETVVAPVQAEKRKVHIYTPKVRSGTALQTVKHDETVKALAANGIVKETPAPVNTGTIPDTISDMATVVPVKKKLTVVHINELDPPNARLYTQPGYVRVPFKIKFKNGKSASQNMASQQSSAGGFKIKLSPKN